MSETIPFNFESYDLFNESESVRQINGWLYRNSNRLIYHMGFSLEQQIEIIKSSQDALIKEQFRQKSISKMRYYPHCPDNI